MMAAKMIKIQVPENSAYSEMPLTLRGVTYGFTMRWNWRGQGWTADWQALSGTVLVAGVPLKVGRNAIAPFLESASLPYGALIVADATGANKDPGLNSFSSTHQLLFAYDG